MIGKIISHFRIVEKLGKGGMGIVYKAHDEKLDRTVALKFISPDFIPSQKDQNRFLQEAKATAKFNHPNICSIYSIDEYEGQPFIEMEFIEGETLREKMQHSGQMPLDMFRDYALQLAEALSAAHQKGIIHRDIKPENIMLVNNERVKIMDFGLAKLKGVQNDTNEESTLGTLTYMSPEQIRGDNIDERSDLFSLGIVFYEMLTGLHPFNAEYRQALTFQILNKEPEPPSSLQEDLPVAIEDIVMRCLQKDQEKRYRSAADLKLELKEEKKWPILHPNKSIAIGRKTFSTFPFFRNRSLASVISVGTLILLISLFGIRPLINNSNEMPENIPEEKHLAVLPFNNLSPDDIPNSLNDGIMEILTSHITGLEMHEQSLWVIPSTEVRAGKVSSVKEATQLFGANLAVTGSLQHIGDQLLLTINLVDGATMRQLRSVLIKMPWSNQTQLQDEVVQNLTDMLEVELEPDAVQSITAGGTSTSEIYQRYIEGQGYLSRYDAENIDRAIKIFRETIVADTAFVRAYAALAETYWRKYELNRNTRWADEAINYGSRAIDLMDQQIPEVYITMALINNGMERYDAALEMLAKLSGQEQKSYRALIEQAKAFEGLGDITKAEELYHQAIDRKSLYWDGYNILGLFYKNQGRFEEAAKAFEKVTELAPANVRALSSLAGIYHNLGRTDQAIATLHRSLKMEPTYRALTNLGTIYFYQRDYSQAIRFYEQALELNDTDRRIWGNLGYAYQQTDQDSAIINPTIEKAIALTEQELEVTPNNQELLTELAGYYLVIGDAETCRKLVSRLTKLQNIQPDTRISLIALYEQLGERDLALLWMETTLKLDDNIEILESLEEMEGLLADPRVTKLRKQYAHKITDE